MNAAEKKELIEQFARFLDTQTTDEITVRKTTYGTFPEDTFEIGDVIDFTLTTGEEVSAMAMRKESDGMLFVFCDCLKTDYPMNDNDTNEGGYEASKLRKVLNGEILGTFPEKIRNLMKSFENGDHLRLLTEKEVFGENKYGEEDNGSQLEPMKSRKNRIAFQGKGTDEWEWWWLQNKAKDTASHFAHVHYSGHASDHDAGTSCGVRPAFKI